jgi:hypothetical protein
MLDVNIPAQWKALTPSTAGVPSGLPHHDGAFRVEQARKESRQTLEAYRSALKRYTEFITHGIMPEDLSSSSAVVCQVGRQFLRDLVNG